MTVSCASVRTITIQVLVDTSIPPNSKNSTIPSYVPILFITDPLFCVFSFGKGRCTKTNTNET